MHKTPDQLLAMVLRDIAQRFARKATDENLNGGRDQDVIRKFYRDADKLIAAANVLDPE